MPISEEVWVGLVLWVFLMLAGLRFKEPYLMSFSGVLGLIVGILILTNLSMLIGLCLVGINLYLLYNSLTNW